MKNERNDVISSVGKRRHFSLTEKQRLVAATLKPGASVAAVAREAGIRATQLYGWRLRLLGLTPKGFAPVRIAPEVSAGGTLEIDFVTGARMRISGAVDIAGEIARLRKEIEGLERGIAAKRKQKTL